MSYPTLSQTPFRHLALHRGNLPNSSSLAPWVIRLWVLSFLLLVVPSAFATQLTLQWDASPSSQVAGYKVYYGYASRQYSMNVDAGQSTTAALSNLKDAQICYFAVTTYDTYGNESTFSNEVSYDLAKADTDKDGLSDWEEISLYKTDPNQADTDGDGIANDVEVSKGSNPLDPRSTPGTESAGFAVNAGGPQYTATDGNVYLADTGFVGGATYTTTATIAGTADPMLYQSVRYGNFSYAIPVNKGDYMVTLRFAEIYYSSIGQRVFDVEVEGVLVVDNLDLIARVGKNVAYDVAVSVHVTDGILNISFRSVVDLAKVSAIEISQTIKRPQHWADYAVSLKMWSKDDDSIGVMFRYQDGDNYYRFSWDNERFYRRLVKRQGEAFSLLAEDAVPYVPGWVYQVGIVADGAVLEVWIEGMRVFSVTDTSFSEGSIALYTWNNWGSYFDDVVVTDLDTDAVLLSADFTDGSLTDWTIIDDGKLSGPSAWSVVNGALLQNSDIYTKPTNRQEVTKLGTYLLYKRTETGM
jgi:hypothetical protein